MKEYKKCDFREKANVCQFRPEDCNSDACDFYDLEYNAKAILKRSKEERKKVVDLQDKLTKMKKERKNKTKADEYKTLKLMRNDKVMGMAKLAKAYMNAKRTK